MTGSARYRQRRYKHLPPRQPERAERLVLMSEQVVAALEKHQHLADGTTVYWQFSEPDEDGISTATVFRLEDQR